MSKTLLVTGATGKQGGSVVTALLERNADFEILAVTRNPKSSSAQKLADKSPKKIKLIQGDMNDAPGLFATAKSITSNPIWGVYSVQSVIGHEEVTQGKALIDESLKNGVKHFVYSSVERGGDERSWENATPVPHFQTKHEIENYLKETSGNQMGWTILRPVAFMENLLNGFGARVFLTAMHDSMGDKPMQWVATTDIGFFAADAFEQPDKYNHKAIGLAGDQLTSDQVGQAFLNATGKPLAYTFSFLGSTLRWAVTEMRIMIDWFASEGYEADISSLRKTNPKLKSFEDFLRAQG